MSLRTASQGLGDPVSEKGAEVNGSSMKECEILVFYLFWFSEIKGVCHNTQSIKFFIS